MKLSSKHAWTLFLVAFIIITGLVSVRRAVKGSNDFDTYHAAGRAVMEGKGIYYSGDYYKTEADGPSPFLYPPFAAVFFVLFALFPIRLEAFLWNAFNIALYILCAKWCFEILSIKARDFLAKARWPDRILIGVLLFAVLLDNLTMAQANIFVFAVTLGSLLLWTRGKEFFSGFVLAAAVLMKLTPALFLLFFICRMRLKVLAGFMCGMLLLALVIPTAIFGLDQNRIYHRQWAGRAIKPQLVHWISHFKNEMPHPDKKTAEVMEKDRRSNLLLAKNQAFAASMTRLFLKDRVRYGYEPEPIYAARRYEKMPVLYPIPEHRLLWLIYGFQLVLLGMLALNTVKTFSAAAIFPAFLLGMTLFSPLARSHQFISWIFVYIAAFSIPDHAPFSKAVKNAGRWAAVLYFLQALPYGKAAGMGTWANLTLFVVWNLMLLFSVSQNPPPKKMPSHVGAPSKNF